MSNADALAGGEPSTRGVSTLTGDRSALDNGHNAGATNGRQPQPQPPVELLSLAEFRRDGARGVADVSRLAPHRPPRRDSLRRRALALTDVAALALAYLGVWLTVAPEAGGGSRLALIVVLPLWVLLNKLLGLYDRDANVIHKSTLDELPRILQSVLVGASFLLLVSPLVPDATMGGLEALAFAVSALIILTLLRTATRAAFNHYGSPERCLIVGSGPIAHELTSKFLKHPEYRVQLVGCLDDEGAWAYKDSDRDATSPFERVCERLHVERVLIAFSRLPTDELQALIQTSKQLNLQVTIVPRLFESIGEGVEMDSVHGMTLFGLRGLSRTRSSLRLKRAMDLALTTIGLLALAPLMIAIAIAIKLTSRGPVLFHQRRIGRGDEPFRIMKFRTMHVGADALKPGLAHLNEAAAPMFKIGHDPRVTRLGRALRRFSLDELPQLLNVMRGEMSLVGPRPLVPLEDELVIGRHRERLDLTPGLTGPWQVMGRTAIPFPDMVKLDYQYVAQWSLWNDAKLLIRTAPVVARGDGR